MVIAWLAESRGGWVRRGRRGVDGYGVGNVASREESALEDILAGSACYLDAAACQYTPERRNLSIPTLIGASWAYRDPTALYRLESASMTSLLDAVLALRFGVATLPATLLRLLSAMANQGSSFVLPGAHAKDLTPKTHTSSGYAIQRNERNEKARARARPSGGEARACGELLKLGADTVCCGVWGGVNFPHSRRQGLLRRACWCTNHAGCGLLHEFPLSLS